MKLSASVKQWALAFVAVDALALLLLFTNCVLRPADCLETFTFGPLILYLPVVLLLDTVLTDVAALPVWMIVAAIIMLGTASHALLGALVGWALGNRRVPPPVSFLTGLVILALLSLGFAGRQLRACLESLPRLRSASFRLQSLHAFSP
jgi:hypothetical protein